MSNPDLRESPLEKLQEQERKRPKAYNWGLIVSIGLATALFFVGIYVYTLIFPSAPVTVLVAFQIIFAVFTIFFITYTVFAVYHAIRFGFEGDLTIISTATYLVVSVILIIISVNAIF